jgi:hypothetical protein
LQIRKEGVKFLEDWKIKIAVLWSLFEFCIIAVSFVLIQMAKTEEIVGGTPEEMLATVISSLIPPIMAFLSLTLKDSINRWLNIIVGIFFVVMIPIGTGFGMIQTAYLTSVIVITIVEVLALALIIWYAWKSKLKT